MSVLLLTTFMMIIMIVIILVTYASRYRRVPPNAAMVVFGKRYGNMGFTIVKGGGKFITPIVEEVSYLPLDVRTLDVTVQNVVTAKGVMLDVSAVAQVKISRDEKLLQIAAEQLLHKSTEEINYITIRTLEGHVRGVCARLMVEDINADRNKVSAEIQDVACEGLANMGLQVVNFTIREISDNVGYLQALESKRTAEIREAAIKRETMAIWRGQKLFDRYAAVGKSVRVLTKALEALDKQFGRDNRDVMSILEESGLSEEELFTIEELIRTPGEKGDSEFQEKVRKIQETLDVWKQNVEERKRELESWFRGPAPEEENKKIRPTSPQRNPS